MEAFCYVWFDNKKHMAYIGYHKGTVDDGYVCSCKHMLNEYENRPKDFKREILDFGESEEMFKLESELLKYYDAKNNPSFYNKTNNDWPFIDNKGKNTGPRPENTKQKMKEWWKNNPKKIIEERLNNHHSRNQNGNNHWTYIVPEKIDTSKNINKMITCKICGKTTTAGNISRWHKHNGTKCNQKRGQNGRFTKSWE